MLWLLISITFLGLEQIQSECAEAKDLYDIYVDILSGKHARHPHFSIYGAYLFREHVVKALHVDGCNGHLGCDKTLALFGETYSWPHLNRAVQRFASYAKFVSMLRAKRKTIG